MQAVILAGGKGTRLKPYTAVFPKPLVPLGSRPILEVVLGQLVRHGVRRATLSVGHMAHLIRAYFAASPIHGCDLEYSTEPGPLGTAGPLALIDTLDDEFLVVNGDILTDLDFGALVAKLRDSRADATMARFRLTHQVSLGVVEVDQHEFLTSYVEKPKIDYDVSMGAYAMKRSTVERWLKRGERADLPDLMHRIVAEGGKVSTHLHRGMWLDIGRPEDYAEAQRIMEEDPALFGLSKERDRG